MARQMSVYEKMNEGIATEQQIGCRELVDAQIDEQESPSRIAESLLVLTNQRAYYVSTDLLF